MREFVSVYVARFDSGEQQTGIGTLVIDREPINALTRQVLRELADAAEEVSRRDDVSAVILFGGHGTFCAGDDVPELQTLDRAGAESADRLRRAALDAVAAIPKPTVAAVTGYALGAGLSLALAADWRVAGDNVRIGATEILAGLVPGGGGGERLARTVGHARAKELTFSGRFVGPQEALKLGLVDELVAPDDVYDAALAWANRFADAPAGAVAAAKALIDRPGSPETQVRRYGEIFAAAHDR
jgi:enoyl-CoA hydratase